MSGFVKDTVDMVPYGGNVKCSFVDRVVSIWWFVPCSKWICNSNRFLKLGWWEVSQMEIKIFI